MSNKIKPIPKQYRKEAESLIHRIGQLSDELWKFISELGDSAEIECGDCVVIIKQRDNISREKE